MTINYNLFGLKTKIVLHWSLLATLFIFCSNFFNDYDPASLYQGFLFFIITFSIVLIHELGHSYTAIKYDYEIKSITLMFFGGAADCGKEPSIGKEELLITIFGPAMNLILFIAVFPFTTSEFENVGLLQKSINVFGIINLAMLLFNMLPAFPMDGGRILRSMIFLFNKNQYVAERNTDIITIITTVLASIVFIHYFESVIAVVIMIIVFALTCQRMYNRGKPTEVLLNEKEVD